MGKRFLFKITTPDTSHISSQSENQTNYCSFLEPFFFQWCSVNCFWLLILGGIMMGRQFAEHADLGQIWSQVSRLDQRPPHTMTNLWANRVVACHRCTLDSSIHTLAVLTTLLPLLISLQIRRKTQRFLYCLQESAIWLVENCHIK